MGRLFTCDKCQETFEADWPEGEAEAEYQRNFPGDDPKGHGVVCEVCYDEFWRWAAKHAPELKRV